MGLLGVFLREGKERAEEYAARQELEKKLGRRISNEELYSIGSHIEAAGTNAAPEPLKFTPREASTPFADAKPPMSLKMKLILFGGVFFVLFVFVAGFALNLMQDSIKNYMNPPPEGTYPQTVGEFNLAKQPYYQPSTSYDPTVRYSGEYKRGAETVQYRLTIYKSEADATAAYNKIKDGAKDGERSKLVENSDNRVVYATVNGWNSYIYFREGNYLKTIDSYNQKSGLDFEGFLKNQPPQTPIALNENELKKNAIATSNTNSSNSLPNGTMNITQVLNLFQSEVPSERAKSAGKVIKLKGTVETSGKDKKGNWIMGFMRPGSTTPTAGMVVASFEKSEEYIVTSVKKGDEVTLKCTVMMKLAASVILENCSKLPN